MLKLRLGMVVVDDPLTVRVGEEERRAWADPVLVGEVREGDEVIVNVEALDLGLGSGGFDVVHANLSRGLEGGGGRGAHVMKLNYSSLQHAVEPAEEALLDGDAGRAKPGRIATPVLVLTLHGQLPPAAWAFAQARPGGRLGYVQSAGGALPGSLSRDVRDLRRRGLLEAHLAAGPAYGGEHDAITLVGAIDAASRSEELGLDAVVVAPGPGILGSATAYGHGGMAALENAHAALSLGLPTLVCARLSSSDPRSRHRGLSHHSRAVLEMLLASVRVPVPETEVEGWPLVDAETPEGGTPQAALDELIELCGDRHDLAVFGIDLDGYRSSGLPTRTMGRDLTDDPLFFASALAAGAGLAAAMRSEGG
jgi:hypothetical protein